MPLPSRFPKGKRAVSERDAVVLPVDPVEVLIVRAISMTLPAAQFGVSPNGEVFTAYRNGWTINDRIYVTRLSWLLDEAADVFNHRRAGRGGRFYERDGEFFAADGKVTFLRVDEVGELGAARTPVGPRTSRAHLLGQADVKLRHAAPKVRWSATSPPRNCSLHKVALNPSGTCDVCSQLITQTLPTSGSWQSDSKTRLRTPKRPQRPWWRFW